MASTQAAFRQTRRFLFTSVSAAVAAAVLIAAASTRARAQAFAELKTALVDYSKADIEPRKACDALGKFKSKEIAQINAAMMQADAAAPAHCRVTGLLSPEIAFEVSLPAKWNGRFYMIGNGGHAGEAMDDPGRVAQRNGALKLGFAFAQTNTGHDARRSRARPSCSAIPRRRSITPTARCTSRPRRRRT